MSPEQIDKFVNTRCRELLEEYPNLSFPTAGMLAYHELVKELAEKAARWDALINSDRLRIVGSAGFSEEQRIKFNMPPDYRHFGIEAWSRYNKGPDYDFVKEKEHAVKVLTDYADAVINNG